MLLWATTKRNTNNECKDLNRKEKKEQIGKERD